MTESTHAKIPKHSPKLAGLGYFIAALSIWLGWSLQDARLVVASEGLGYALGIVGSLMMVLLLLYPLRKRARFLRQAGPIRHWFRIHMMLGVAGPILVLFHSNFSLGSINSQVALFCTIVVASSGIVGRYLYAKIHNGMYGQRLTFDSVRTEIESARQGKALLGSIMPILNKHLVPLEDEIAQIGTGFAQAFAIALKITVRKPVLKHIVRKQIANEIDKLAQSSQVVAENKKRLLGSTSRYLSHRLSVLLKFAQLQACERLFSWWHVVHYPLFIVMVVAAIVHVVAVHMY